MGLLIKPKDFLRGSLFFIACSAFWAGMEVEKWHPNRPVKANAIVQDTIPAFDTAAIRTHVVIGVGDIMLGTNYPSASYLPPHHGKHLLAHVKDTLLAADVLFGNLEGTLFDGAGKPKTCIDSTLCYLFRSPAAYVQHLTDTGFDFISLANNHSGDFGAEGRALTKATLAKAGLLYAGLAGTDETAILERNGLKWGFCAFAPNGGACDIRNIPRAKAIVQALSEQTDIVIVSFHGGAEGPEHQHVPRQKEEFHGENRGDVYAFAHAVVDAGADIVFGHGPHVTRAVELYNDRFIAYSLGNFCTYGRFKLIGPNGYAPIMAVTVDDEGRFVEGQITPVYQQKHHGPKIDPQKRAIYKIIELTRADFPETILDISLEGKISLKQAMIEPVSGSNN